MKKQVFQFVFIFIAFIILPSCEKKEDILSNKNTKTEVESQTKSTLNKNTYRLKPTKETRATYKWYCAQCHGITGEGSGINSHRMPVKPINHKDPALMSKKTDNTLFTAISQGGLAIEKAPCMPSFKHTLDKKTIAHLVGYLRELCKCEYSTSTLSTPSIRLL